MAMRPSACSLFFSAASRWGGFENRTTSGWKFAQSGTHFCLCASTSSDYDRHAIPSLDLPYSPILPHLIHTAEASASHSPHASQAVGSASCHQCPLPPPPLRAFVHADAAGAVICGLILLVNFALSRRNSPKRQRARLAESSRLSTRFKKPGARSHLGCVCV